MQTALIQHWKSEVMASSTGLGHAEGMVKSSSNGKNTHTSCKQVYQLLYLACVWKCASVMWVRGSLAWSWANSTSRSVHAAWSSSHLKLGGRLYLTRRFNHYSGLEGMLSNVHFFFKKIFSVQCECSIKSSVD